MKAATPVHEGALSCPGLFVSPHVSLICLNYDGTMLAFGDQTTAFLQETLEY
jgi:hypothetical protein